MIKFNRLECARLNDALLACLQTLGFSTITFWVKPEAIKLRTRSTKLQELNLQLALDWLIERHVHSRSKWLIATSLASALAIKLIIRRPEVTNYLLIAPIINRNELTEAKLLARLKPLGAIILAEDDTASALSAIWQLVSFASTLKVCALEFVIIRRTNHFFASKLNTITAAIASFHSKVAAQTHSRKVSRPGRPGRKRGDIDIKHLNTQKNVNCSQAV
ncbi:MAG: hypothetical protein AAI946_00460 [Candidatus Hodgkinia cicadicola]